MICTRVDLHHCDVLNELCGVPIDYPCWGSVSAKTDSEARQLIRLIRVLLVPLLLVVSDFMGLRL